MNIYIFINKSYSQHLIIYLIPYYLEGVGLFIQENSLEVIFLLTIWEQIWTIEVQIKEYDNSIARIDDTHPLIG